MQPIADGPPTARPSRALVIDDEPRVQRLMSRLLALHGLQSAGASDGEDGLHRALLNSYAVILLDLQLPKLDGMTVLRRVMSTKPSQQVIVCSGQADYATRQECLREGARQFLPKPFAVADLTTSLQAARAIATSWPSGHRGIAVP